MGQSAPEAFGAGLDKPLRRRKLSKLEGTESRVVGGVGWRNSKPHGVSAVSRDHGCWHGGGQTDLAGTGRPVLAGLMC